MKESSVYKEFIAKADYYKQLLDKVIALGIEEVAKDTNLVYEMMYARSTLEKLLANNENEQVVKPLYDGFNDYIKSMKEKSIDLKLKGKRNKKLAKVKYSSEKYNGKYEVEKLIHAGTLRDPKIIRTLVYKACKIVIIILFLEFVVVGVKGSLLQKLIELILNAMSMF